MTIDQVEPFQASAIGSPGLDPAEPPPTAIQKEGEVQLTPAKPTFVSLGGLGDGVIVQEVPLQLSIKVDCAPDTEEEPTATLNDELTHDTLTRLL